MVPPESIHIPTFPPGYPCPAHLELRYRPELLVPGTFGLWMLRFSYTEAESSSSLPRSKALAFPASPLRSFSHRDEVGTAPASWMRRQQLPLLPFPVSPPSLGMEPVNDTSSHSIPLCSTQISHFLGKEGKKTSFGIIYPCSWQEFTFLSPRSPSTWMQIHLSPPLSHLPSDFNGKVTEFPSPAAFPEPRIQAVIP